MATNISNAEISELLIKDEKYTLFCKKLVKKRTHLVDELIQITAMTILETKDNRFIDAFKNGYIRNYICATIYKIWSRRNNHKIYKTSSTHELFDYSNTILIDEEKVINYLIENNNNTEDLNKDKICKYLIDIIREECNSNDPKVFYRAKVFNYSNNNIAGLETDIGFKSPSCFAYSSGIQKDAVFNVCKRYKVYLKERLKQCPCY